VNEAGLAQPEGDGGPLADITEEARRILAEAEARSVLVRLVGGLAIRFHAKGEPESALSRPFKDIDLVTSRQVSRAATELIVSLGYEPNNAFNTMNSGRRALFYDFPHERQLDVFVGSFEMCHKIPIADRLDLDPVTVPLAELLLTKLQIIQLNEKDLRDIFALVLDHEVAEHDDDVINAAYIAKLCSDDWGLWRTCKQNVERFLADTDRFGIGAERKSVVDERLQELWARIESEPKSRRWRLRDRVGDRVRWYETPEEVA
jgi:hypothetical protein